MGWNHQLEFFVGEFCSRFDGIHTHNKSLGEICLERFGKSSNKKSKKLGDARSLQEMVDV